jgi:hypothetical protein
MLLADLLLVGSLPWERPGWNPLRGTATTLSPGSQPISFDTVGHAALLVDAAVGDCIAGLVAGLVADHRVANRPDQAPLADDKDGAAPPSPPPQKNPIITRIDVRAGHGAGKPTDKVIAEVSDMFGFAAEVVVAEWKGGEPTSAS